MLRSLAALDGEDEEENIDTEETIQASTREQQQRSRRRNRKDPAIVILERKAIEESKQTDRDNLRVRLPDGLETPKYDVIDRLDQKMSKNKNKKNRQFWRRNAATSNGAAPIEIRKYEPYSVCSVSMDKPRPANIQKTDAKVSMPEMSGASSFGALAGYLFGKNEQSTSMKMTTPVFTKTTIAAAPATTNANAGSENDNATTTSDDEEQDTTQRQMSFVLPSDYWTSSSLDGAPKPLEGSGVELQNVDSETRAVIMFGGYASPKEVTKRKQELLDALNNNNKRYYC